MCHELLVHGGGGEARNSLKLGSRAKWTWHGLYAFWAFAIPAKGWWMRRHTCHWTGIKSYYSPLQRQKNKFLFSSSVPLVPSSPSISRHGLSLYWIDCCSVQLVCISSIFPFPLLHLLFYFAKDIKGKAVVLSQAVNIFSLKYLQDFV